MKDNRLTVGSRRRCDCDGKPYTVKTETHRFCSDKCRADFHRYGSPFLKLREKIATEVDRMGEEIEFRFFAVMDRETQNKYRAAYPARGRRFDELRREQLEEQAAS